MPTILDSLIVLLKLDAKQFDAEAAKQVKAVEQVTTAVNTAGKKTTEGAKVSAADRKRIEDSQAQRAVEREKKQEKQRKDTERSETSGRKEKERQEKRADREAARSKEELGDKVKGVALGIAGAFLGFETFMGAVKYLGALNTSTAALGRNSQNLGTSAHDLQTWGNAVEQVGGDAKEAQATFGALSQTLTGFKLRGESSPLLQLFQNMGVYVRDAKGNVKELTTLLVELGAAMQNRGLSRADAFNLAQNAGISESVFNLLYDKNGKAILADASDNAFANQGIIDRSQKRQEWTNNTKQAVKKVVAETADDVFEHPSSILANPLTGGNPLVTGAMKGADKLVRWATDGLTNIPADRAAQNSQYAGTISDTEQKYGLPSGLLGRIAYQESHFRPDIISGKTKSSAGAVGLMQLMPKDFPGAGQDANEDIRTAGAYLAKLYKQFGSWEKAVAAYNDGPGNISKVLAGKKQLPLETQRYLQAVATPGLAGNTTNTSTGGDVNFHGDVNINSSAKDGAGVAGDFMGDMKRRGVLPQANSGMT